MGKQTSFVYKYLFELKYRNNSLKLNCDVQIEKFENICVSTYCLHLFFYIRYFLNKY